MKRIYWKSALTGLLLLLFTVQGLFAQAKLGQTGFQFLSVGSDARAGALANAMTTIEAGSSSLFYNPAGMARLPHTIELAASQNRWLSDINYFALSLAYKPANGRYGIFGFSYIGVDYGAFEGTMIWGNEQGYINTETFYPTAAVFGFGYANALSDRFAIGAQVKYANQYLGRSVIPTTSDLTQFYMKKNIANGLAFDFGTSYKTPLPGVVFGMSVRNFSKEIKYEREKFQLPLMFRIGVSMDAFKLMNVQSNVQNLLLSIDAFHPRSYPEYMSFGLEYGLFNKLLSLRGGYVLNRDIEDFSFGFGISKYGVSVDYAYLPTQYFDAVQRFTLRIAY